MNYWLQAVYNATGISLNETELRIMWCDRRLSPAPHLCR